MLFNSLKFIFVFLPITMLGFHLLGRYGRRPVIAWLALASVVFYAAWNPIFVLFLLGSILINYLAARIISAAPEDSTRRKQLLAAGISLNLLALFYFKYLYKSVLLLNTFHLTHIAPHPILLPLGISFFTFTQISYLVDLAQGQAERQDFLSYLLFVTFFPHLIAGPILHHKEMMPQFGKILPEDQAANLDEALTPVPPSRQFSLKAADVSLGLTWFLMGLAKKVLIADQLSPTADLAFSHFGSLTATSAWTGLIVYSMQLYFDFSGYSDMALGLARIFSIRFPLNFDSPYKATSVTEYWQRWHMTLTRYITLYLYNPLLLGVQRRRSATGKKISRKALTTPAGFTSMVAYPTLVTMLLTGLWHGAGLQFVIFGLIHGIYLIANQAWRHFRQRIHNAPAPPEPKSIQRLAMMIGVYLQVAFALIFFRSESMHAAITFLHDLAGAHGTGSLGSLLEGTLAFALFPVVWFMPNTQQILGQESSAPSLGTTPTILRDPAPRFFPTLRWSPTIPWAVVMAILFFAVLVVLNPKATFLYFQF
ncbi:MBOAT family O-acyltransferase [Granulicella tundricola]|uniref:Membrane bound O-acyl transferase MBOAT family protein n=1 Tax=Granulicella tundricola (strain ATCC BAA-1859 / DSM 23138 / MP5ACTX9) TaxID=1198114 RepID=E8WY96_GRATM|nr:MBOAT family O-acyltransferase [Granulicella tundricola]ADW68723.1 membrane bound O-acyl transferase MBOAT family protein [Granulicella tundricola MP5ACTX9]